MIRIVLLGRTGNNLFQYALGRVLAGRHGVPLRLDAGWFNHAGWSEVSHFLRLPIQAEVVRPLSVGCRLLRKLTGRHRWEYLRGVPWLREDPADQSFDARFLEAPADCVLFGYFQSPLYFASIEDALRSELRGLFGVKATGMGCDVAVHVRRGDYLKHPDLMVCDVGYYQRAMDLMRWRLSGCRFFVYSDDPDWCRANFAGADVEVVDPTPGGNPLPDLCAMAQAGHHILANSSYSWWAAWLARHPDQVVLMPSRWNHGATRAPIAEKALSHWECVE